MSESQTSYYSKKYHPLFRSQIRPIVMLLDNYSCRGCSYFSFDNHVHHIDGNKHSVDINKMVTLCSSCHTRLEKGTLKVVNPSSGRDRLTPEVCQHLAKLWSIKS
jgi:5-methylcytosine-specific restriction endonuclease McrA